MVLGAELLGEMRRRVHRNRRTDQDLRVPSVLRDAAVQHFQWVVRPVRGAVVRMSGINYSVSAPEGDDRFRFTALRRTAPNGRLSWTAVPGDPRQSKVRRTGHVIFFPERLQVDAGFSGSAVHAPGPQMQVLDFLNGIK